MEPPHIFRLKLSPAQLLATPAEGEGFEPPVPESTVVFKTTAIDRSANPPKKNRN